jgi:hypothetical protein
VAGTRAAAQKIIRANRQTTIGLTALAQFLSIAITPLFPPSVFILGYHCPCPARKAADLFQHPFVHNKIPASWAGIVIGVKQKTTRSSGWEAFLLKFQAGLLAHGSPSPSTFPDLIIQWSLEALPIYSGPTAQDSHLNSLFSLAFSQGTWSLVNIHLSGSDFILTWGDCQYVNKAAGAATSMHTRRETAKVPLPNCQEGVS